MDASVDGTSLAGFLVDVDATLRDELGASPEPGAPNGRKRLASAAHRLALAGEAKRARPSMCFTLARTVTPRVQVLRDASVGIELIHTASLLHDDVVDGDTMRRGIPTANAREGNAVAVLTGDFVLSRALQRMRVDARLLPRSLDVLERMTIAALVEIEARGDVLFSEDGWRAMAAGKTGVLFGLCGAAAALAGNDESRAERFFAACAHLGVAFQIADDVADLASAADLREKNPSFPVIAAATASARVRAGLLEAWGARGSNGSSAPGGASDPLWAQLVDDVIAAGGVRKADAAARAEIVLARQAFARDAAHPAVVEIFAWADALVARAASEHASASHSEGSQHVRSA